MLSSLSIDDQTGGTVPLHETSKRAVVSASGLVGVSPPRRSVRVRPTGHGAIDETRYVDEALVTLVGDVWDSTQQGAYTEFRAIVAPMLATLDGQAALLKWTEGAAGLSLQRLVKLASAVEPLLSEAGALLRWQAVLSAADPCAYSQTLTTATGAGLNDFVNAITNPSFEVSAAGWTTAGFTTTFARQATSGVVAGSFGLRCTGTTTSNDMSAFSPAFAVTAGQAYSARANIEVFTAANGSSPGQIIIQWDNGSSTFALGNAIGGNMPSGTGTRVPVIANAVAPAGATQARLRIQGVVTGTASIDWLLDAVLVVQASTVPTYFDGDSPGATWGGTAGLSLSRSSSGGSCSFTNAGNRPTRPLLRIFGPATNPIVRHPDGRALSLRGTIASTTSIDVYLDVRRFDPSTAASMLDPTNTRWFDLAPGTTALVLQAGNVTGATRLDVIGRSAYA